MSGPGVGEAWLFKDSKYGGFVWKFNESKQSFEDFGCKNKVSSVRVGPGTTVLLFKEAGWKGSYVEFNTDTSSLGSEFNDATASIQILKENTVYPPTPGPGEAFLYRDANFEGFVWRVKGDVADVAQIGAKGKISSVRVGPGNEALLFNETNFKGKVVTASGNLMSLPKDHNDKVGSIKIMQKA